MSKTITKEIINSTEIFKEYFKTNNVIYYEREVSDDVVTLFLLPYRIAKKYRINIKLFTASNSSFCRMYFKYILNNDNDYSKRILEINSEIENGGLSLEPNTNVITFKTDFTIEMPYDVNTIYEAKLYECFMIFKKLMDENIIKVDVVNEE